MISLGSGLSLAGSILIAQYFGARDHRQVNHIAAQTLIAMIMFSVLLTVAGYAMAPTILHCMGVDESIYVEALRYLRISFTGMVFLFLSFIYQAVLRGVGETKAPLRIIFGSVVLNAVLDPLLIYGWGRVAALGVSGAAYATLITQFIAAFAGIRLMLKPQYGLSLKIVDFLPDWPLIRHLFKLGFPASVEQSMQALTVTMMTLLVLKFGTVVLASYGITFRIVTFLIMLPFSIAMSISMLVGQSLGAGNLAQSHRIAVVGATFNFIFMASIGVALFFSARPVLTFFVPHDVSLIDHGSSALRIFAFSFAWSAVQLAFGGAFRGAGATFAAMLLTIFGSWAVQLPLAFLLSHFTRLGELGLWWASPVAAAMNAAIATLYFRSNRWIKKPEVTEPLKMEEALAK
jgi:putative MATE family efflux protein